jgi:chorismate mutase
MSVIEELAAIANMPDVPGTSEEDVKIIIALPFLRAFGYTDADFNYEGKTGRGYVDIATGRYPVGIVVETKAPHRRLTDHLDQLETYVFKKHSRDRATIAMLSNGRVFHVYGITDALCSGELVKHELERFERPQLADRALVVRLSSLFLKDRNESGHVISAIQARHQEITNVRERIDAIDRELEGLAHERIQIDARVSELQAERGNLVQSVPAAPPPPLTFAPTPIGHPVRVASSHGTEFSHAASSEILKLLQQRSATSRQTAVQRSWLDSVLIGKLPGVDNQQAVSFSLIELRRLGKIDYEKPKSGGIRSVWLT